MKRRFATLDVFSGRRLAGNPLAVVLDADGLDGAAMQAIAREFNLSETVFVFPPRDPGSRARLRIFTPASELPFAGHPTVGTAVLLGCRDGGKETRSFVLEEEIGPVQCEVTPLAGDGGRARFLIPRKPEALGAIADIDAFAAALSLSRDDIGCEGFSPGYWSAGVAFAFIPLRGLDAMNRCRPDTAQWKQAVAGGPASGVYVFCRETVEAGHHFHARMFAPLLGVAEDPATGSAAAAFAGVVARHAQLGDGDHDIAIEQGYEMGRPSVIRLSLTLRAGAIAQAMIGGEAMVFSEGQIEA
jgi:trans-2,3-dihydro-3-hydroxyanthranilate isomerase